MRHEFFVGEKVTYKGYDNTYYLVTIADKREGGIYSVEFITGERLLTNSDRLMDPEEEKPLATGTEIDHPQYYNRYSVEVVEMARRIWGDEAMKTAAEITAFIYRMRAGTKPDNPVEKDLNKEQWWLDYKNIKLK